MLKKITLSENIQARLDRNFSDYLLQDDNGTTPITIKEKIRVPNEMFIPFSNDPDSLDCLIDVVFQEIHNYLESSLQITNRAILTLKNKLLTKLMLCSFKDFLVKLHAIIVLMKQ